MSDTNDLDLSFLYEIADGSNEFIVESITMFLQQTPELLQMVDTAIQAKDWSTAASAAHKLKPNLGFFGMLNSQALLQDVEMMSKTGSPNPAEVSNKFGAVKQLLTSSLAELERIKQEKEAEL
ncbi:Hpt domain-containing protein [Mucilaginibacter limnophilus]|uniref:Hpt domain-containing protein n=1 Tax=Mucilaginibacter limnophilus TaxID=1932778 RepID=A0A3S2Y114_9SPHI|nr:Hpt domain-containing protein [Mucilaginibacter limnophilus]RVT98071.1 Hpt domain-containing protein [Mucilaginibacter limnophilus]